MIVSVVLVLILIDFLLGYEVYRNTYSPLTLSLEVGKNVL